MGSITGLAMVVFAPTKLSGKYQKGWRGVLIIWKGHDVEKSTTHSLVN
jgi:hypothetical protein